MQSLTETQLRELVYGGAVLGGGGGGSIQAGLASGRRALDGGLPRFCAIDELALTTKLVTLSVVGSMSAMLEPPRSLSHAAALQALAAFANKPIGGLIPSEVGPQAVTYGWIESARTGIPIVDAPCNGRAHPFGLMGSLGLHRHPEYTSITVAVGGKHRARHPLVLRAPAWKASRQVRRRAAQLGLALAVARNPLPVSYVRKHAAVGGLTFAARVGRVFLKMRERGVDALLDALQRFMAGYILLQGRVTCVDLADRAGFTRGSITVNQPDGRVCRIAVCNEYLAAQKGENQLAAFPDLITLFDRSTGLPLSSAELRGGQRVAIFAVPASRLPLGSTMKDRALLASVSRISGSLLAGVTPAGFVSQPAELRPAPAASSPAV